MPPGQGSQASGLLGTDKKALRRLSRRPEFLQAARGLTARRRLLVVQAAPRGDESAHIGEGFTATKKVGNAVVRNRAKRRLREVSRTLLPDLGLAGHDYVFIARQETGNAPWARLLRESETVLKELAEKLRG